MKEKLLLETGGETCCLVVGRQFSVPKIVTKSIKLLSYKEKIKAINLD